MPALALLAVATAVGAMGASNAGPPNMNGPYRLSNTPKQVPGKFPATYGDYPGAVEFFDVYSPPVWISMRLIAAARTSAALSAASARGLYKKGGCTLICGR